MSSTQRTLFENDPTENAVDPPRSGSLVRKPQRGRPLSRTERAFNRLVTRVETLQNTLAAEVRRLDAALVFEAVHVRPRLERVLALRKDVLQAVRPFLLDRRLTRADRRVVEAILVEQIEEVLAHDASPDEDIRQLFEQIHRVGLDEVAREQIEDVRSEMKEMFADIGLDIDIPDLRMGMSDEETAASAAQFVDHLRQHVVETEGHRPTGRRTPREAREEARIRHLEDTRKTTIGAIYKRLVKVLHPDLERDTDLRARKGALMQEVTAAHAAHDLLALLRLELQWVVTDPTSLPDDTLAAYNRTLQDQAGELGGALAELPYLPRYQSLTRASGPFGLPQIFDGPEEVRRLDTIIESLTAALARMAAGHAHEEVRGLISEYRRVRRPRC